MTELARIDDLSPENQKYDSTPAGTMGMIREQAKLMGIDLPGSAMKVFGKQIQQLWLDDVAPDMITAAAMLALRRGKPHLCQVIALDLQLAAAGARMSDAEYEAQLALHAAQARSRDLLTEHAQRREEEAEEIRRRRGGR